MILKAGALCPQGTGPESGDRPRGALMRAILSPNGSQITKLALSRRKANPQVYQQTPFEPGSSGYNSDGANKALLGEGSDRKILFANLVRSYPKDR